MERFNQHWYGIHYLEYTDLIYTPLFIGMIYFFFNAYQTRMLGAHNPLRKYLIPALSLKIFGSVASGLVYQYYYGGGDTMDYYTGASVIYDLFFTNFDDALGLLNSSPLYTDPGLSQYDYMPFINESSTYTMIRLAAVVDLFSLDSYPILSLYFALFSLYASWKMFSLMCRIYPMPALRPKLAYCFFYIPSVVFWGSGLFKDTVTLSGLYLFTVHIYLFVIKRELKLSNFVWIAVGLYLMVSIRLFYLIILIPCLLLWFFGEYRDKLVKSKFLKSVSFPLLIGFSFFFIVLGLSRVLSSEGELNASALKTKAEGFQSWHGSLGGSMYDLGITDYGTASLIRAIPLGINVAFFRPYLWETHSFFQIIAALQSLFFLYYTLRTLFRSGFSILGTLATDPFMLFSLPFSLLYGFVAGFTSYNFGALDRYKIPALPFFMLTLIIVNYYNDQKLKASF